MSTPPRYAVVGTLCLDNVVAVDGTCYVGKPGGNVLWSAAGARLWTGRLGVVARAGADYPAEPLARLAEAGVDLGGVTRTGEPHGLRIAYRHRADGGRDQPVPQEALGGLAPEQRAVFVDTTRDPAVRGRSDPAFTDIPAAWLDSVRLWHLPLLPLRLHRAIHAGLRAHGPARIIADCPNRFEIGDLAADMAGTLPGLEAFLPSTSDLDVISPGADGTLIAADLAARGSGTVVLKQGAAGSLVVEGDGPRWQIPAYPSDVVDPTGAGDAFCGGFLVGLGETGDVVEAAARGAVSASYAVETADPLAVLAADPAGARTRLAHVKARITKA
ncbi:MAG: hypothetical protein JWN00_4306 [Actinomycetia bacterium]|nr:hypothetical protein [Actinomycetes bacterium]